MRQLQGYATQSHLISIVPCCLVPSKERHVSRRTAHHSRRLVQMGYQTPQQLHPNEECDSKGTGENWDQQLDSDEEDTRKGTSKILFRAETTREGSYGDGHRLHVDRGTK